MNTSLRNRFQTDGAASISQERLLLALYERLVTDLDKAMGAISATRPAEAHDALVHAQQILEELHLALDTDAWDGADQLASLYLYAIERLVEANLRKDAGPVREVKALIVPLAESWRQAYEQMTSARAAAGAFSAPGGGSARPVSAGARFEFGA